MSLAHKRRYALIARAQWDFSAQTKREQGKFFRHLSQKERSAEILRLPARKKRKREPVLTNAQILARMFGRPVF